MANSEYLLEINKIADLALKNVSLIRNMDEEEWKNISTFSRKQVERFYLVNKVNDFNSDLEDAIAAGNFLINKYMKYFNTYQLRINNCNHNDQFKITETDFHNWFSIIAEIDTKKILDLRDVSMVEEASNSIYFRSLMTLTRNLRATVPYNNELYCKLCGAYCIQAPILFPSRRKELLNIGMAMTSFRYLCWLGGRLKIPGSISLTSTHETCLVLLKVARALNRD